MSDREVRAMARRLEREIATFEREREHLEREHLGKYALVHGDKLIDTYDDFETAADEGLKRFGDSPFLIRRVGEEKLTLSPAVLYGLTGAHPPG